MNTKPALVRDIPIASIQIGGHVAGAGDWHEHDIAALALHSAKRHAPRRICFDVSLSRVPSTVNDTGWHPVVIVEGEPGYRPTTFDIGANPETCLLNVRRANEALGLTAADVKAIVASSFF